jgi:hypothetical protein
MKARAGAVRMSIAVVVTLGAFSLAAIGSNGVARAASNTISVAGLANAKLPAGVCSSGETGVSKSGPIQLSHGGGTVGTMDNPDYFSAGIVGTPVHINLGGTNHTGVAVVIVCGAGGSAQWTSMWVFGGSARHLTTLFGGVTPRSYAQGVAGSLMSGISAKGGSLVVQETYSMPGDNCLACATGRTTTTWSWSSSNTGHLVITQPPPKKVVVVTGAAPGGFGGLPATLNQAGPGVVAGRTVLATCTAQSSADGTPLTELDTGAWLPSGDLMPSSPLPDCDSNPGSNGAPSSGVGQSGTSGTTTCPTAAQAMTAWTANPGTNQVAPGTVVSNIANISCWKNWVLGFAVSNSGNGSFVFSQTGGLHSLTAAESSQFNSEVCSDPTSPSGWRGELGC